MNRPNLFHILPVALGMMAASGTPGWAQGDGSAAGAGAGAGPGARVMPFAHRGGMMGRGIGKEFESIRNILTEDQKPQFEQIIAKSMEESRPMREQLIQLQQTSGDNPDAKTQSKIDDLKAQMREHRKQTKEKLMAILTPQQKAQIASLKGQAKGRRAADGAPAGVSSAAASAHGGSDEGAMGAPDGDK